MAPLTQGEIDGIVDELKPYLVDDQTKAVLGVGAYKVLLTEHPEYVQSFTRLQGLSGDAIFVSEGIKYYGRTLANALVLILLTASDDKKLNKQLAFSGHDHATRSVESAHFREGLPSFLTFFDSILSKDENKAAMRKFLEYIFPRIADEIDEG